MSDEAELLIYAAFLSWRLSKDGRDPHLNEELQLAQLHYSHKLRRFKQEHPMFCGWGQRSEGMVIEWRRGDNGLRSVLEGSVF